MQAQDYAYLYELEENFWWFVGMREISQRLLDRVCAKGTRRRALDAGCGTGGMVSWLRQYTGGGRGVGIDLLQKAVEFFYARGQREMTQSSVAGLSVADSN